MNHVIVKPVGGLANRLRAMEAGYNYASTHRAKLTIIWEKNKNLNAAYAQCFLAAEKMRIIDVNYNGFNVLSKLRRGFLRVTESVGLTCSGSKKIEDADIEPLLNKTTPTDESKIFFDKLLQQNKNVFIKSCFEFYPNLLQFRIHIQTDIQLQAYHLMEQNPALIGLHVRRTDKTDAIARSPLKKFIEEINNHLLSHSSAAFYLSTDSEKVAEDLKKIFPGKIITGITVRARNSKEGVVAALTDLCCLSQCKKILGSYDSSFSERAAIMGNIPLQIVTL